MTASTDGGTSPGDRIATLVFDHVTIRVENRAVSEEFYETVLIPLGIETTYRTNSFAVWHEFMVTQASDQHPVTRGLHVSFVAPTRAQVDEFWQAGVDAGYPGESPPGPRPQHGDDCYGALLRDPSGNTVEAVHDDDLRRRDGIVDHLWVGVADLVAATAFYRLVAAAVGFDVREDGPERTTVSAGERDASFSLGPGPPRTEHLHIAFPGDDDAVARFYVDAVAAGYRGNGEPGERPQYHPGYYAAYVLDPDGNNIEVVNHHLA